MNIFLFFSVSAAAAAAAGGKKMEQTQKSLRNENGNCN